MAFTEAITRPAPGDKAKASHITNIHDILTGVPGFGEPISLTQVDHPTFPALAVCQKNTTAPIFRVFAPNGEDKLFEVAKNEITVNAPLNASGIGVLANGRNLLALSAGFNNPAEVFRGIFVNATNTQSGTGSCLEEFQVGGQTKWKIDLTGKLVAGSIDPTLVGKVASATSADNADTVDNCHAAETGAGNVAKIKSTGKLDASIIPTVAATNLQGAGSCGDQSFTSSTFVDMPGASVTITAPSTGVFVISWNIEAWGSGGGSEGEVDIFLNSTSIGAQKGTDLSRNAQSNCQVRHVTAGQYTIKAQGRRNAGGTGNGKVNSLDVVWVPTST